MGRPFNITKYVERVIFKFDHGYVGIYRITLTDLYQKFPNGSPENMPKYLASKIFLSRLLASRCYSNVNLTRLSNLLTILEDDSCEKMYF
ncbi:401_t:CDS:2, partial [Acaulospora morrowiae]